MDTINHLTLVRITNITHLKKHPGHFVDFAGQIIPAGRSAVVDLTKINPEKHPGSTLDVLENWSKQGLIKVADAKTGTPLTAPAEIEDIRAAHTREAAASRLPETDLDDFEADFDPSLAKEARMPGENLDPISQSTAQVDKPRVKVSLSGEEPSWDNSGTSPLPGSKPVHVDNSEAFTVKAPRSSGPGAVVGKT